MAKDAGDGVRPLRPVEDGTDGVRNTTGQDAEEAENSEAGDEGTNEEHRRPPNDHVGNGIGPLGRIDEELANHNPDDRPDPGNGQEGHEVRALKGNDANCRVGPGDTEEDGGVVRPAHALTADGPPVDEVE